MKFRHQDISVLSNEYYLKVTGKKQELLMCPKYRSGKFCGPGAYVPYGALKIMTQKGS